MNLYRNLHMQITQIPGLKVTRAGTSFVKIAGFQICQNQNMVQPFLLSTVMFVDSLTAVKCCVCVCVCVLGIVDKLFAFRYGCCFLWVGGNILSLTSVGYDESVEGFRDDDPSHQYPSFGFVITFLCFELLVFNNVISRA